MATQAAIPNKNTQIRKYPLASGQTTVEGDVVYLDGSGDVTICSADPATILGFQAHDYNSNLEVDIYSGEVLVYVAYPGSTFWLEASTTVTQANEGQQYGIVVTSGSVAVDISDTTNVVLTVETVDLTRSPNLCEVSILPAVAQLQGG